MPNSFLALNTNLPRLPGAMCCEANRGQRKTVMTEQAIADHITSLLGPDVAPSPEVELALTMMYRLGRQDTLDMLGLEEDDLPCGDGMVAWSA